jgi:hypothetical protein
MQESLTQTDSPTVRDHPPIKFSCSLAAGGCVDYAAAAKWFESHRYLKVLQLLPAPLLSYLKAYYHLLQSNGRFSMDRQCPKSLSLGGDPALDAVAAWVMPVASKLVGLALAPTYSFTRLYASGDTLLPHKDRKACEISITACISIPAGAEPSTLFLRAPKADPVAVEMSEGDACIYAGTEVEHWREPFSCDGYVQLFLHFIDFNGPHYPSEIYDGRSSLGAAYPGSLNRKITELDTE